MSLTAPLRLTIELVRARQGDDPYAFQAGPQPYLARSGTGTYSACRMDWDPALEADLAELSRGRAAGDTLVRVGRRLRDFLDGTPFPAIESALELAARGGPPVLLTLRLAAAELFALPWELVALRGSGLLLGQVPGALVRLCWPDTRSAPLRDGGGGVLFAWSEAGGPVPSREQGALLREAAAAGSAGRPAVEELGEASAPRLVEALERASQRGRPFDALHLLCHGVAGEGGGALLLNDGGGGAARLDGLALQGLLGPYAASLRLVVLAACSGASVGARGTGLGGVAQPLHRAGLAAVVGSRAPLSMDGASTLTRALWQGLLGEAESLEGALRRARAALGRSGALFDQSAIVLYSRDEDGDDTRPLPLRPYRGLLNFEAEDRSLFFGREAETVSLANLTLAQEKASTRLVVVVGASGAGKSSLVRAGLIPALGALAPLLRPSPLRLDQPLQPQVDEALRGLPTGADPVWIVDPLDSLFSAISSAEARAEVAAGLLALAAEPTGVLVATLRPDLLARCEEVALPAGRRLDAAIYASKGLFFLAAPEREQLRAAIERPATRVGLDFEPGLVDRLLDDAGQEPGALPLLQYVLDQLWEARDGRKMTHAAYEAAGGLGGALARAGDALIARLGDQAEQAWALLDQLVSVDEEGAPRRRAVELAALQSADKVENSSSALAALTAARLVVLTESGGRVQVQLGHEALLRRWGALRERVAHDRQRRLQAEEIRRLAEQWGQRGQDADYLLRGRRLGFALEVSARAWKQPPAEVQALLDASVQAEQADQQAQAAALAERERLAAEAREAARRARDAALLAQARLLRRENPSLALLVLREVAAEEKDAGWVAEALALLQEPYCTESVEIDSNSIELSASLNPQDPDLRLHPIANAALVIRGAGGASMLRLAGHTGPVTDAAWSRDGAWIVTASEDCSARVWSHEGLPVSTLAGPGGPLARARFTPDGQSVLLASRAGALSLARVNGEGAQRLPSQIGGLWLHAFSADGALLATVARAEPRTVRVRSLAAGGDLALKAGNRDLRCLAFSNAGERLAAGSDDGLLWIWALPEAAPRVVPLGAPLRALAWAQGEDAIFAGGEDGQVQVVEAEAEAPREAFRTGARPVVGLMAPVGGGLRALTDDGQLGAWRVQRSGSPQDVPQTLGRHRAPGLALRWTSDDSALVSAAVDGTARLASPDGRRRQEISPRGPELGVLAARPDGGAVAGGADDGSVRIWETGTGGLLARFGAHSSQVEALCWSRDGRWLASGAQDCLIQRQEIVLGVAGQTLRGHRNTVTFLAFGSSERAIWSASEDGTARLWLDDACVWEIGPPAGAPRGHPDRVNAAALAPEGGLVLGLASGVILRAGEDGSLRPKAMRAPGPVLALALSPSGRWLAASTRDGEVLLWARDRDQPIWRERLEQDAVEELLFDPQGTRLVMRSRKGLVSLLANDGLGAPLRLALASPAARVAPSPTGDRLAVLDQSGALAVWPVTGRALSALMDQTLRTSLTAEQRRSLLGERLRWEER